MKLEVVVLIIFLLILDSNYLFLISI